MFGNSNMPNSIVAFADALGTSASTRQSSTATDFLERLERATEQIPPQLDSLSRREQIAVRWFSDSIAMSTKLGNGDDLLGLVKYFGLS